MDRTFILNAYYGLLNHHMFGSDNDHQQLVDRFVQKYEVTHEEVRGMAYAVICHWMRKWARDKGDEDSRRKKSESVFSRDQAQLRIDILVKYANFTDDERFAIMLAIMVRATKSDYDDIASLECERYVTETIGDLVDHTKPHNRSFFCINRDDGLTDMQTISRTMIDALSRHEPLFKRTWDYIAAEYKELFTAAGIPTVS